MTFYFVSVSASYADIDFPCEQGPQYLWSSLMTAFEEDDDFPALRVADDGAYVSDVASFVGVVQATMLHVEDLLELASGAVQGTGATRWRVRMLNADAGAPEDHHELVAGDGLV